MPTIPACLASITASTVMFMRHGQRSYAASVSETEHGGSTGVHVEVAVAVGANQVPHRCSVTPTVARCG